MSNVSDYLKWRGDLDFSQAPFNDVDNLILAQIAYVDFTDIVPAPGSIETITIAEAADTFFDTHDEKEIKKCKSFIGKAPYLLREAAATKRFGSLILTNYVDYVDGGKEEQFAAFHVRIDNRLTYIAFRGTDDTLVGWKEDFNMGFVCPVPAQTLAVSYLEDIAARAPDAPLYVVGHSKGGHNAIYAASVDARCRAVGFNAPGFGIFLRWSQLRGLDRGVNYVLNGDVSGFLLFHLERRVVLDSSALPQEGTNPFTAWHRLDRFFPLDALHTSRQIRLLSVATEWITQILWLVLVFLVLYKLLLLGARLMSAPFRLLLRRQARARA